MKKILIAFFGFFLSFNAFAWNQTPGLFLDVGDGWAIGTGSVAPIINGPRGIKTNFDILRWNDKNWEVIPGGAYRIGGTYSNPWIINIENQVFRWTGSNWQLKPGITAFDVTDGWAIGTDTEPGGHGIYRWDGLKWVKMPGSAMRIGGKYTDPWVVNNMHQIFHWTGSNWHYVVNQHAKITRERVESTLKSFHPRYVMIRHFVGVPWGVINGSYSRNQATPFH